MWQGCISSLKEWREIWQGKGELVSSSVVCAAASFWSANEPWLCGEGNLVSPIYCFAEWAFQEVQINQDVVNSMDGALGKNTV